MSHTIAMALGLAGLAIVVLLCARWLRSDGHMRPDPETRLPEDDLGPDNDRGMW